MNLRNAVRLAGSVLSVAVFFGASSLHANTYDVEDFQLAGVTLGDSESEVVENIANYFSVPADKIQLLKEKEYPARHSEIGSSFFRTYVYDNQRISVTVFPDYLNGNGSEWVVGRAKFVPNKERTTAERQTVIDEMKNKIVADKGVPSKETKGILPIYYWCTEMTEKKRWPCVLDKPYLQLDFNLSTLDDKRYARKWTAVASERARQK